MKRRYLLLALIVLSFTSLFIGAHNLSPLDLLNLDDIKTRVLLVSRIPRLLSLLLAGMSMGVCGLIMQQLTQNRFVSPTTAGTLDSARLGILVSMLLFASASTLTKMLVAFLFALLGTFVFMQMIERIKFKDVIFVPLAGMMLGGVISSIATFFALRFGLVQNISSWLLGDFSTILAGRYELLYINVPMVALAYLYAGRFTIAGMGEDVAKSLGLNYRQVVQVGLAIVAMITASVVLTVGTIPFLGLIVPNIVSLYRGDNLKNTLSLTALVGGITVLLCDILGRVIIFPYEIPISLTIGLLGSAAFIYLLMRRDVYEY